MKNYNKKLLYKKYFPIILLAMFGQRSNILFAELGKINDFFKFKKYIKG